MKDRIAETVKEHLRYAVDSFAGVLSFDIDPTLSEEENTGRIIAQTALVCSVIAVVNPVPLTEFVVLTPIHAKMTFHVGKAKGFAITQERALEVLREVVSSIGLSLVGGAVASFVKLVPIVGVLVYVPIVYGTTHAIGRVVELYFDGLRSGHVPTVESMKELFQRELTRGKAQGASIRREEIDRAYRELKAKVEERERVKESARAERGAAAPEPHAAAPGAPSSPPASRITVRERHVKKPIEKTIGDRGTDEPAAPEEAPAPAPVAKPAFAIEKTIGPETPSHGTPSPPVIATAPAPVASAPASKVAFVDELERLAKLRDLGALTPEEFDLAKKKLLS